MDIQDLKNKSIRELHELLAEKRNELRELRFKVSEKQLKNVSEIKKVRKTVAQVLTIIKASNKAEQK
ncbi:MAG: 50S ribosomal protein L29 [Candidatus Magasanikbacteria bacterium]|jgi:large subunit ribosomal protein L29|nr:50S ribosomal protein L29 [Candidatus Magasanikbacteria bacterium]MBT4314657.1 50S ribosomal protein L29 [Candidatus Magasanikbacteria bacterium]MBT4547077.1 50S ribosomal protein L29 [Candidatus Magasanikbacteria bacterium]MBT6819537.1 50S ribosomal protein L29 [Candidatus Magasanikbacteria bacterium]